MSVYQKIAEVGTRFVSRRTLFKLGFNLAPMYRRTTARILDVSDDLLNVRIKLPISYKNRNYVNSIFGGSMFSAVDPIPMVQLMNLLDSNYVVWDKSAQILFKRPAKEDLYAEFSYTLEELDEIRRRVKDEDEIDIVKSTSLTNKDKSRVFCVVDKTIYVADKTYFKQKRAGASKRNDP